MIKLIASSSLRISDISEQLSARENRRKSPNMVLASEVLKKLLAQLDDKIEKFDLYICSGDGELTQTFKFYESKVKKGTLSPTLFQSSLHNSTLGTLSLEFKGIINGMSISNGVLSFEDGISLALNKKLDHPIIIVGVDVYPEELREIKASFYGENVELVDGACAGVFVPEEDSRKGHLIKAISYERNNHLAEGEMYPANGLEELLKAIEKETTETFKVMKPQKSVTYEIICHAPSSL